MVVHLELWRSVRVTIGFLVTSLTMALLPRLLSLAGWPALGRVLVVPNFVHLRMTEATVILGTFNAAETFGTLPQICASKESCLGALWTISSTSLLDFCSDMHCQLCDLIQIDWWVPPKSCPVNRIYRRWTCFFFVIMRYYMQIDEEKCLFNPFQNKAVV